MEEAEEDLENLKDASQKWKNIVAYYACYNAFYGLLLKIGIKSEIHDCTIEIIFLVIELKKYESFLKKVKKSRINVQYYLGRPDQVDINKIKLFVLDCNVLFDNISFDEVQEIRGIIKNL